MKSVFTRILLIAAVACVYPATAQSQQEVKLSLAEFKDLFSSAHLNDAERRLEDVRLQYKQEHALKLAQMERENMNVFPDNFQMLQHSAAGYYNSSGDIAVFNMQITFRVMEPQWTMVPLVTNTTLASDWKVYTWEEDEFTLVNPITSPEVLLPRNRDTEQVLATNRSGLFQIQFKTYSRIAQIRNLHQLALSQLLYPLSEFSLRLDGAMREFSVQPAAAVLTVHPAENSTEIKVTLPMTSDPIEIRWLNVEEEVLKTDEDESRADKNVKDNAPRTTVVHEVMHSVEEGMVRSNHILEFTSTSTSDISAPLYFEVHGPNVRITSIEGHALHRWELVDDDDVVSDNIQVIRAILKSSHLESTATLLLHTESGNPSSERHAKAELPHIECRNVLRQVGHIGVIKDANVEVHQHAISGGVVPCESTEISSQLRLNMDRPIVLSYKYLNPRNGGVILEVQEHTTMNTLEASVDRVHYKAVATDTHIIHSLIVVLQSTKLQYLELFDLPQMASMFTLLVNSVPAKPVKGKDRSILVPLLVGLDTEAANAGHSMLTSIELTYISTHEERLGRNGTLLLAPPYIKLPISVFTSHLRLPKNYDYEFAGDFGESTRDLSFPVPSAFSYQTGKRVVDIDYTFSFKDDVWPDENAKKPQESTVKIVTPNTGRSFYFHRLLVVDMNLGLNATYTKREELVVPDEVSWWQWLST